MHVRAYKHARLMEESEWRIEIAAGSNSPDDVVVRRVLDSPVVYRRWAFEHDWLLRGISTRPRVEAQVIALRSAAMNLVHRKALFEYLRERQLNGRKRRRLFQIFYGSRDYSNAVLAEHGNYVRCCSSYVCAQHLSEQLMHDAAVEEPMQLYEQRFGEFFSCLLRWRACGNRGGAASGRAPGRAATAAEVPGGRGAPGDPRHAARAAKKNGAKFRFVSPPRRPNACTRSWTQRACCSGHGRRHDWADDPAHPRRYTWLPEVRRCGRHLHLKDLRCSDLRSLRFLCSSPRVPLPPPGPYDEEGQCRSATYSMRWQRPRPTITR